MSNSILILGESGTGKSTAIRTLPPENTFIINVLGKNLPWKGSRDKFKPLSSDGNGNYYATDDTDKIKRIITGINNKRPDIKYLVIDDCGYTIMNEFMRRALEKGYDKFSILAQSFSNLIRQINELRDDLFCFVMMHVETDNFGKTKPKIVGRMIDQYVCIEGCFTYIFHTAIQEGQYKFLTNHDGLHMAKNPMGLFDESYIDNDLFFIANKITEYLKGDEE